MFKLSPFYDIFCCFIGFFLLFIKIVLRNNVDYQVDIEHGKTLVLINLTFTMIALSERDKERDRER